MAEFLDLVARSGDGVWDMTDEGTAGPGHSHWRGFANRTAKGMRFERLKPAQNA